MELTRQRPDRGTTRGLLRTPGATHDPTSPLPGGSSDHDGIDTGSVSSGCGLESHEREARTVARVGRPATPLFAVCVLRPLSEEVLHGRFGRWYIFDIRIPAPLAGSDSSGACPPPVCRPVDRAECSRPGSGCWTTQIGRQDDGSGDRIHGVWFHPGSWNRSGIRRLPLFRKVVARGKTHPGATGRCS